MKKEALALLLLALPLPLLPGCAEGGKGDAVPLTFGKAFEEGEEYADRYVHLTHAGLLSKVSSGESFLLLVADHGSTCLCYVSFQETLGERMEKENLLVYSIDPAEFGGGKDALGLEIVEGYETLAIFSKGKLVDQEVTGETGDPFTSDPAVLGAWLEERVRPSSMLYVDKEQLDTLYEGDESFTLGFLRSDCPDCRHMEEAVLQPFNEKERNRSYVIDVNQEGIRLGEDGEVDQALWESFKEDVGLSEGEEGTPASYGEGYVPSFLRIDPNLGVEGNRRSMVVDGFTYMNDVLMEEGGKFLLEDSFYDEGRASSLEWLHGFSGTKVLKGREIPKEEVLSAGETLLWDREYSGAFHDPLANAFLEFYIPEIAG